MLSMSARISLGLIKNQLLVNLDPHILEPLPSGVTLKEGFVVNRSSPVKRIPIIPSLTLKPISQCNGDSSKATPTQAADSKTNESAVVPQVKAASVVIGGDDIDVIDVTDDDDSEVAFELPKRIPTPPPAVEEDNNNGVGQTEDDDQISEVTSSTSSTTAEPTATTTTTLKAPKHRRKPEKSRVSKVVFVDGHDLLMADAADLTPEAQENAGPPEAVSETQEKSESGAEVDAEMSETVADVEQVF